MSVWFLCTFTMYRLTDVPATRCSCQGRRTWSRIWKAGEFTRFCEARMFWRKTRNRRKWRNTSPRWHRRRALSYHGRKGALETPRLNRYWRTTAKPIWTRYVDKTLLRLLDSRSDGVESVAEISKTRNYITASGSVYGQLSWDELTFFRPSPMSPYISSVLNWWIGHWIYLVDKGRDNFEPGKLSGEINNSFGAGNQVEEENMILGNTSCFQYLNSHNCRPAWTESQSPSRWSLRIYLSQTFDILRTAMLRTFIRGPKTYRWRTLDPAIGPIGGQCPLGACHKTAWVAMCPHPVGSESCLCGRSDNSLEGLVPLLRQLS